MKKIIFFLKDDYYYKYFKNDLIKISAENKLLILTGDKKNQKILSQKYYNILI